MYMLFCLVMALAPFVRCFNLAPMGGVWVCKAALRMLLAPRTCLIESKILLRSFCVQKFRLEECIEHESESYVMEQKDNGEIVSDELVSPKTLLRGTWILGPKKEVRMKLERTYRGKFADYTSTSHLVGGAVVANQAIHGTLLKGKVRDTEDPSMSVGGFYMVPWS